jgi:alkylation response protein AidB-like acyl-CoA dehydrogenase
MRASETTELIFTDCRVPVGNVIGKVGDGFVQALKVLDGGRISIAALSLGIAQGAFEAALQYSKERHQFNQPISNFQGISFKLADMATEIEAASLLTYRAADMKDRGQNVNRESAMAKLYASEVCVRVANEADLRRLRLHQGLPRRAVLPRLQAVHHRRGHLGDSEAGHCPHHPEITQPVRLRY